MRLERAPGLIARNVRSDSSRPQLAAFAMRRAQKKAVDERHHGQDLTDGEQDVEHGAPPFENRSQLTRRFPPTRFENIMIAA